MPTGTPRREFSMRILSVGWGLAKASGVTTFVERTAAGLRRLGHAVEVIDTQSRPEVVPLADCDVVHLHCLWKLHAYSVAAKKAGVPVVYSTHGMTAPWSMRHKWWKKLPAWWLYQRRDLTCAAAIHCTTQQEAAWNHAHGFEKLCVVPLGTEEQPCEEDFAARKDRTLLFVGRIYPVKGLVNLLRAWKLLQGNGASSSWRLRLVGPDEAGHLAELQSLVAELGLRESVEFPGPKFDAELSAEYANCDCLALPSFTENFGATVVDALAHGKPCIASTFTPWEELAARGCGWWVSNEPPVLAEAIREMMDAGDARRRQMGERGQALVREKYTWDAVAASLCDIYRSL